MAKFIKTSPREQREFFFNQNRENKGKRVEPVNPNAVGIQNLNDVNFIIQYQLVSRLFAKIFHSFNLIVVHQ